MYLVSTGPGLPGRFYLHTCEKVTNFQNPELRKLKSQNLQSTYKILNGQ